MLDDQSNEMLKKLGLCYKSRKKIPRHRVAELVLYLEGKPFSMKGYELFHDFYDDITDTIVYKCGRQVSKSTNCSGNCVLSGSLIDNYKMLYVNPLKQQVYRFSNLYLKAMMRNSPLIKHMEDRENAKSIMCKMFSGGGVINLTYTSTRTEDSAERYRGIPADELILDEMQDIPMNAVPILDQCLSASKRYGKRKITGTPKTMENPLEIYWARTNQMIRVFDCEACRYENAVQFPDAWEMIGEHGPRCAKCKKPLNVIGRGTWVELEPALHGIAHGYHIPQIIVPFNLEPKKWRKIYQQFLTYPKNKFANEVLGLSYDSGGRLVTLTELMQMLSLRYDESEFKYDGREYNRYDYEYVTAGVDWSGGGASETSFTTLTILGRRFDGTYDSLFNFRFIDKDPLICIPKIVNILRKYNVDFCGCDWGMGHTNNKLIQQQWCPDEPWKVVEFQYTSMNELLRWNKQVQRYMLNKTYSLNVFYINLKEQKFHFIDNEYTREVVFSDFLALYEDISEGPSGTRKIFKRNPAKPDDLTHSHNFAMIIAKKIAGELMIDPSGDQSNSAC